MLRAQLLSLISDLRSALGRSTDVAVGSSDVPRLKWALNRAYQQCGEGYDWPHLRAEFDPIPIQAGQRYYDLPGEVNHDRIEELSTYWNARPYGACRGISIEDYNSYDPTNNERSGPVTKWDIRFIDTREVIELWPVPSTNEGSIRIIGERKLHKMVNDADLCWLDDDLVVTKAAMALAAKDEKQLFAAEFSERWNTLTGNAETMSEPARMSGRTGPTIRPVIVRVR